MIIIFIHVILDNLLMGLQLGLSALYDDWVDADTFAFEFAFQKG